MRREFLTYLELARPKVLALVLFSMGMAAWIAGGRDFAWTRPVHALVGMALVIVGAVVLNQRLERRQDAAMLRTARRPLVVGRLSASGATLLGTAVTGAGLGYLAVWLGVVPAALAAAGWALYVLVYTPLKTVTPWQTPVGAAAGAMPMLFGAAVADAAWTVMGTTLFAVVYFWQFPHAMAIAWLYRRQYAAAGIRVAPVVDPTGNTAGRIATAGAVCLSAASLMPCVAGDRGWSYGAVAAALTAAYLAGSIRFLRRPSDGSARLLLRLSIVFLPALLAALFATAPR